MARRRARRRTVQARGLARLRAHRVLPPLQSHSTASLVLTWNGCIPSEKGPAADRMLAQWRGMMRPRDRPPGVDVRLDLFWGIVLTKSALLILRGVETLTKILSMAMDRHDNIRILGAESQKWHDMADARHSIFRSRAGKCLKMERRSLGNARVENAAATSLLDQMFWAKGGRGLDGGRHWLAACLRLWLPTQLAWSFIVSAHVFLILHPFTLSPPSFLRGRPQRA
jgi:hypothetical protein